MEIIINGSLRDKPTRLFFLWKLGDSGNGWEGQHIERDCSAAQGSVVHYDSTVVCRKTDLSKVCPRHQIDE